MDETAQALRVAVRWRQDLQPDTVGDAELEVLRRHLAELMRDVQRVQEADEPTE